MIGFFSSRPSTYLPGVSEMENGMETYILHIYLMNHSGISADMGDHCTEQFLNDAQAIQTFRKNADDFRRRWSHRYRTIAFTVLNSSREKIVNV